jgi:hypothetical protein
VTLRLNGGGATLLGPGAAGSVAAPLLFEALGVPAFLVPGAFFALAPEGFRARCDFAPALVVCFSWIAMLGRCGALAVGFGEVGAVLPDEPLWPEVPVELGEPVEPEEPVLLGAPEVPDEPAGLP